jgi:hypothetical protein
MWIWAKKRNDVAANGIDKAKNRDRLPAAPI